MSKKQFDIKIDKRDPNNVVLAKGCFSDEELENKDKVLDIVIGSLVAKYKDFTFTKETSDDFPNSISVLLPLTNFKIRIHSSPDKYYDVDKGDFLTFPSETIFNIFNKDSLIKTYKIYYYPKIKKMDGSNKYIVRATLEDNYNIEVYANTEDEALQKAYNIPLPEWNHEEIDDRPEKMKIIRWSRWGNLKIIDK
jgi:hypothetical protein